jgi:peptidoglycan hydrolase-like protein with peptidoglycan-binding domain
MGRGASRACVLVATLACAAIGASPAAAADAVTLDPVPDLATFDSVVRFTGTIAPARQTHVEILRDGPGGWELVAAGDSRADGTFSISSKVRVPGLHVARTDAGESPPALLRIKPVLTASLVGARILGAQVKLVGRVRPAAAGTLALWVKGKRRPLTLDAQGRFEKRLSTRVAGRLGTTVAVVPADGYASAKRRLATRVRAPVLRYGSRGAAVGFLERRLRSLKYALARVDGRFNADTRDALYAFQKVRGLSRSGRTSARFWRVLRTAKIPKAAVPSGTHIEVDKARQVLFEVRRGRVVSVVHVSTGATGNTPIGRWRIYSKTPGFNSLHMYYSMYFLRGFAVHGYPSVPTWPASHGCVRLPNWFAPRLYARWGYRSAIWVFPTTARGSPLWQRPAAVSRAPRPAVTGPVGP